LLNRLVALGHEWEIVPVGNYYGGDDGFELNVHVGRSFNKRGGLGENQTHYPTSRPIQSSDSLVSGRIVKTAFNVNTVLAIGDDGEWTQVHQHPWFNADHFNSMDPAPYGYQESFGVIEEVIDAQTKDRPTLSQFAEARLKEARDNQAALQLVMQRGSGMRPFVDFGVGDSVFVDLPPVHPDPPDKQVTYAGKQMLFRSIPKRVRAIQADLAGEGSDTTYTVDIDRVLYEDELAWFAAIAKLQERSPADNPSRGTGDLR
jgi:hypothetical protein